MGWSALWNVRGEIEHPVPALGKLPGQVLRSLESEMPVDYREDEHVVMPGERLSEVHRRAAAPAGDRLRVGADDVGGQGHGSRNQLPLQLPQSPFDGAGHAPGDGDAQSIRPAQDRLDDGEPLPVQKLVQQRKLFPGLRRPCLDFVDSA